MYIKSELFKIMKSKKSIFFIILIFLIPFIDLISNMGIYREYWTNKYAYPDGLASGMIMHPVVGSFLTGSGQGHISQMLLVWMMPIYLMIIYSDSYIREVRYGYNNIIFSKTDRKTIIRQKYILSFLVPFLISLVSLIVNFILAQIIFHGGTENIEYLSPESVKVYLINPNITYLVYILIYSLVSGGCGILCSGISFLIPDNKIAYPSAFLLWTVQIISPYSLTYVVQPFIEYGLNYTVPAIVIFVAVVMCILIISYRYKVRYDEI